MSHLHIPDGVLPWIVWAPAWLLAVLVLGFSAWSSRGVAPQQIATRGTLGALVLAAMTLTLPLGPLEYHLSLLGVLGVLAGPAGAFEALFVVSAILAFAGHGGLTVIGLNALVLGAGAAVARPVYVALRPRLGAPRALAAAAAVSQSVAGVAWTLVMLACVRRMPAAFDPRISLAWIVAIAAGAGVLGVTVETFVALGLGRFLERVKPELLPGGDPRASGPAAGGIAA
jgi:ABC-type Co2+ transport system permease subunit